jgi:class 3 adenylate cyclase
LTKQFGVDILMSASTFVEVMADVEVATMTPVEVKGKAAPLEVHQLIRTTFPAFVSP